MSEPMTRAMLPIPLTVWPSGDRRQERPRSLELAFPEMPTADRWTDPVAFARVTAGRWSGWPPAASVEEEARKIRRANDIEEGAGGERWPETEWVYRSPLRPPPKPA